MAEFFGIHIPGTKPISVKTEMSKNTSSAPSQGDLISSQSNIEITSSKPRQFFSAVFSKISNWFAKAQAMFTKPNVKRDTVEKEVVANFAKKNNAQLESANTLKQEEKKLVANKNQAKLEEICTAFVREDIPLVSFLLNQLNKSEQDTKPLEDSIKQTFKERLILLNNIKDNKLSDSQIDYYVLHTMVNMIKLSDIYQGPLSPPQSNKLKELEVDLAEKKSLVEQEGLMVEGKISENPLLSLQIRNGVMTERLSTPLAELLYYKSGLERSEGMFADNMHEAIRITYEACKKLHSSSPFSGWVRYE